MIEIEVGTTPLNLRTALGITANTPRTLVWLGRAQNRGAATIYSIRSPLAPDPAAVRGFRYAVGDAWELRIYSDDLEPAWVWTASGRATLVAEPGEFTR